MHFSLFTKDGYLLKWREQSSGILDAHGDSYYTLGGHQSILPQISICNP